MKRRKFVSWISVGALASSLPVVLAACNGQTSSDSTAPAEAPTPEAEASGAGEFESVGTLEQLDRSGQLLNEQASVGPVLVVRSPDAAESELVAVNPVCTHAGCNVEWQSDQKLFVCPCHNSQFQPDGTVASGPASQPLATYEVKQEADDIFVKKA
ncbi:MAG: ubiquinol-cytochrome c reductase iron-sulfur subunit [Leptolyngbyaceae cyanobacterium SM1_1_3]|nr:ubiquinol-cytochrome c reductase iron-sulfur subunit [Leptolyngbyaceae cyanobacterium SM1_1_3]NJN03519.1 ubiquinol-cytochrome c reductase iron-sulfur subunit [Leptolyngbyaceae cyanobacterium RM1_1_2]NJO10262.1 ubiquinol-cytochrome c reductase iron-sulfur subunit [Leptolyngbyaceae cyanobacterium SL_1_1]